MEHPSGEFLEPATNLSPLDTGDREPPSTSLGQKRPSTVLSDTIKGNAPVGGRLEPASLRMPDYPARTSTGELVELCVKGSIGLPLASG